MYNAIMLIRSYSPLNKKKTFSHQAGFISPSEGHFGVKTIMPAILKGSFQTEVLKTGHFKGPFGMKDFSTTDGHFGPMILCASMWARDDNAEGHFKKQLFGPQHPSSLLSCHSGG